MAPEHLPKLEVWEPCLTPPQTSTSQLPPNSVHITYLCLCYQMPWPSFHLSQLDPCKSHTTDDACLLDSCRGYGVSTASSCVPVIPLIELWPHYLRPECLLLLSLPSPHIFPPGQFFLTGHGLSWNVASSLRFSLTEILNVHFLSLFTGIAQFAAVYLFIFISYHFLCKNKNSMRSRTVSFLWLDI